LARVVIASRILAAVDPSSDYLLRDYLRKGPGAAVREIKRRVLLEAQTPWVPLLGEERALREALLQ